MSEPVFVTGLFIWLMLTSCAKSASAHIPERVPGPPAADGVERWAYLPNAEGYNIPLLVKDPYDLEEALKAMGCGVCTSEVVGTLYSVDILQKERN